MDEVDPADFSTGIVVDVYGPLRGSAPDPRMYARFISRWEEPALELGCGDGDPLLALEQWDQLRQASRRRGVRVDHLILAAPDFSATATG